MKIERFEDIEAWKEARTLVKDIYALFAWCRDFGFRDQIQRASVSIMSNVAEGFDRHSNKEFIQFLVISRASTAEVKSLLHAYPVSSQSIGAGGWWRLTGRGGSSCDAANSFSTESCEAAWVRPGMWHVRRDLGSTILGANRIGMVYCMLGLI